MVYHNAVADDPNTDKNMKTRFNMKNYVREFLFYAISYHRMLIPQEISKKCKWLKK